MPANISKIVRNRRARNADQRHMRDGRFQFGGIGIGIVLSFLLAALILFGALTYADLTRDLPSVELLPALLNPPSGTLLQPTRVYDRTGENLLFTFAPNNLPRRYIPLNLQAPQHLPDFLAKAVVAQLDPTFYSNGGYSLANWQNPDSHPTIAQKLVSDLLLYNEPPSTRRALRERILAAQIIVRFGRNQILEWYLNSADFGHYAFGVDTASELYFGKSASELTPAESAILAAVAATPSLNPLDAKDAALQRGRDTIQLMQSLHLITNDEAAQTLSQTPSLPASPPKLGNVNLAPAFVNLAAHQLDSQFTRERIQRGGLNIITTLDYDLQQQAACATLTYADRLEGANDPSTPCDAAQLLPALQNSDVISEPSASAMILDTKSGQILAAVGETLKGQETSFLAAHDPGSLTTPFVYLTAFTRGFSPASLVWDIPSSGNIQNLDGQFHGPLRIRIALANDYLAPAANIANQMGSDAIARTESSFGINTDNLTLLDAASAFAVFSTQGARYGQPGPVSVLRVEGLDHSIWLDWSNPQAQPIVTPQLAYLMNNVLSDESARWASLGHPNLLEIGRPAAVKLGQTNNGHDVWTVGYTPTRLIAVWAGTHASDAARLSPRLSSGLWNALMQLATQSVPADGWSAPAGVTTMNVCDPSGLLPTKDCPSIVNEVFLNGNEPIQPDNLFRTYEINRETGLLATIFTPPQLIEEKVFMAIPPEAQTWAKSANIPAAPTSYDAIQSAPINPDVHITSPVMFADVSGQVQIKGTAAGANFDHFRVLVGKGLNPQEWIQVGTDSGTAVNENILATWDTTGLDGLYAVQLQVVRTDQQVDTAIIQVNIK